jgi:hypothetical protein
MGYLVQHVTNYLERERERHWMEGGIKGGGVKGQNMASKSVSAILHQLE